MSAFVADLYPVMGVPNLWKSGG